AAISAIRLAMAYRKRFGRDVVVDLVGYRRFGHNEQDEAAYTQPLMVQQIAAHPSVRELYAERLSEEGTVSTDEAGELVSRVEAIMRRAHDTLKSSFGQAIPARSHEERIPASTGGAVDTAVSGDRLRAINEEL